MNKEKKLIIISKRDIDRQVIKEIFPDINYTLKVLKKERSRK